jgi:hypothetical protein
MARKPSPELAPPKALFVEREEVEVFRTAADMTGAGPKPAFELLFSSLPRPEARECYGTYRARDGPPEYYACAGRLASDPATYRGLETGSIPGGLYVRRIYPGDWRRMIEEIPGQFQRFLAEFHHDVSRPSIEFYVGDHELQLFLPVLDRGSR